MSIIKTPVSMKCSHCGAPMVMNGLAVYIPDPDLKIINGIMKDLAINGLCPACQAKYNYGAEQIRRGHGTDFRIKIIPRIEGTDEKTELLQAGIKKRNQAAKG